MPTNRLIRFRSPTTRLGAGALVVLGALAGCGSQVVAGSTVASKVAEHLRNADGVTVSVSCPDLAPGDSGTCTASDNNGQRRSVVVRIDAAGKVHVTN
ncbi:MAG: DUF4333 domain-containing protein [Mycobacteriaceae bacterium]